ncbi:MAG: Glycosyl transferase family 2, partial [Candidatus Collierbacteria bacterium GW2011_GWD2_45_10]
YYRAILYNPLMIVSKKPFFSVVIPALNEEKYLPLLLTDLAKQTTRDFEVIVIDGVSKDRTVEKARLFKNKFPSLTILSSSVRNVSVQRNMGAGRAIGKYLLFNDADNRLPEYFLEGLKYQLHVKPLDLFTNWLNPDSTTASDKAVASYMNIMVETASLLNQPAAYGALIGCRKNIFNKIGGFNREVGFAEDTEFVNRGHHKGFTFGVIREPRFVYSFRRFRKMGKLKMLQKYAVLNLKFLTNQKVDQKKEYPMGGGYLEEETRITSDLTKLIRSAFKKGAKKTKITDRLRALLSLEES